MKSKRVMTIGFLLFTLGLLVGLWIQKINLPALAQQPAIAPAAAEVVGDVAGTAAIPPAAKVPNDGKLRIIVFGAHPDDSEIRAGGVGALWAAQGHHVKFVSLTNGDIGHWQMAGGPLAQRRKLEVQKAAQILGVETEVLDIHDGELIPDLETRRKVVRLIRQWKADIVLLHRPNDYHPDHRNVGIVVQDAGYMVTVPYFCPDTPYLTKNPVFLYSVDRFQKPNPFDPDVVVNIDSVIERKLDALAGMESQFLEGGCCSQVKVIPKDREAGLKRVKQYFSGRFKAVADKYREKLVELYGKQRGQAVQHAEAFEVCEYGSQPSKQQLKQLFPFYGK